MIDKKLYISGHDWESILSIVGNIVEEFNVVNNKYNEKIHTIQITKLDMVFCEYEFDEVHHRMSKLTSECTAAPIITIGDFIRDVINEKEKMDDVINYYISRL